MNIPMTDARDREIDRLGAENKRLREALEAADSMADSFSEGQLGEWEVSLYRRRRAALEELLAKVESGANIKSGMKL